MKLRLIHSFLLVGACVGVSAAEAPNAVIADPEHYTVEFENDVIRVVRIKYGPGETSSMHSHDANCVVLLKAGEIRMELPDGSSSPGPVTVPGEVACNDAGASAFAGGHAACYAGMPLFHAGGKYGDHGVDGFVVFDALIDFIESLPRPKAIFKDIGFAVELGEG